VAGGCFCCRFPDMVSALRRLVEQQNADILIGEPVGSCTDLSATVLQPLKKLHGEQFEIAPFSVLIDVKQVRALARLQAEAGQKPAPRFPDNVLYIYEKQLEEADVIVLNKIDLLSADELKEVTNSLRDRFPKTPLMPVSALNGAGIDAWLDFVLQTSGAGRTVVEVDYDTYAAGEAALGWLNAAGTLTAPGECDWSKFANRLLETTRNELAARGGEIAHLKVYLTSGAGNIVGNLTSNAGPAAFRGSIAAGQARVRLLLNARVEMAPEGLREAVERGIVLAAGDQVVVEMATMRSFFPGRPEPTHRYGEVV